MEYFRAEHNLRYHLSTIPLIWEWQLPRSRGDKFFQSQKWPKSSQLQCEGSWQPLHSPSWSLVLAVKYLNMMVSMSAFFLTLPIMGMQPMCRNLPLMNSYGLGKGQWAVQGGGWERRRGLGADTVLRGLGTAPHFFFTTSLSGGCFHLKEEEN